MSGHSGRGLQRVILAKKNADGSWSDVLDPTPLAAAAGTGGETLGGLTNLQLRATPVPVSGTVTVANPTDGPRAVQPVNDNGGSLTVDGTVAVSNLPSTQPVSGTVAVSNQPTQPLTDAQLRATPVPVSGFPSTQPVSGTVTVANPTANPETGLAKAAQLPAAPSSTVPVGTEAAVLTRIVGESRLRCTEKAVTAVGAAASAVTLTLPAVVGQFHHITRIEITLYSTAARAGVATPITVTSTNLPGNPAWTFATAGAIGTVDRLIQEYPAQFRSVAANTATTIVCPVVTGGLWRINVAYYEAA